MAEQYGVDRLIGEIKVFRDEFRARLIDIDTLIKIADADEDNVLAKAIPADNRTRICDWREREAEELRSVVDIGIIYEIKQRDPYVFPEFTPELFQAAHKLAGELLLQLTSHE